MFISFSGLSLSRPVHHAKLTSVSAIKYSPANVSAYILKLVSFSSFDRRDSDKTEKTNISLLSSMAVAYMNIE